MSNVKIKNDFFKNAILKGNATLLDSFSVDVSEHKNGSDIYFEISKVSPHYAINSRIIKFILSNIPISSSACGFVQGKSYLDFLKPHVCGYYFLRLDIKQFFHSIPITLVENLLKGYFSSEKGSFKYSPLEIALMSVTHSVSSNFSEVELRGRQLLPIGFPSSPVISNIIFRKVDILIRKYCEDKKIIYSRYADDLLFSSYESKFVHTEQFEREISIFISTLSLQLKNRKRISSENTISINGYTIQNERPHPFSYRAESCIGKIRVSNKKIKILKKLAAHLRRGDNHTIIMEKLFDLNFHKFSRTYGNNLYFYNKYARDQLQNKIKGYRSYLISMLNFDKKYNCFDKEFIAAVSTLIKNFEESVI